MAQQPKKKLSEDERRGAYFLRNKSAKEINALHLEAVRQRVAREERARKVVHDAKLKGVMDWAKHEQNKGRL